jgi:2-hydroxychromene-2-carboxylate isomerase
MSLTRVWKENNPGALERNPHNPKREYLGADFRRQAIAHGLDHQWPSVFPVETDLALKVTLLANNRPDLISKIFDAYWRKGRDISQAAVLSDVCTQSGLNGNQLVAQAVKGDAKNDLREATQLAIEAGVFGAPTTVVQLPNAPVALYFGNDRLCMADLAARGDTKVV